MKAVKVIICCLFLCFAPQLRAPLASASETDLEKAKKLNDSQTYDSLYIIPELKALYYQNNHIIGVMENIDKNLNELLRLLKKESKSSE